jgi:hypothetical protein
MKPDAASSLMRFLAPLALAAAMLAAAPQAAAIPVLPGAAPQANEDLEDKVRGALGATIGKPAQEIGVSARDGTVLLFGAVRSQSLRERAARTTGNVLGVRTVVNALTVVRGG